MAKDFFIYTDRDELRTSSAREYRVKNILQPKQLKQAIKGEYYYICIYVYGVLKNNELKIDLFEMSECKENLNSDGAPFILNDFDKLFSMIEFMNEINYCDLHYIYEEILVKSKLYCYIHLQIYLIVIILSFFTSNNLFG